MRDPLRTVVWRRLDLPGADRCALRRVRGGWELEGTAVGAEETGPFEARYRVRCDEAWLARSAEVSLDVAGERHALTLRVDRHGAWFANGTEVPAVHGSVDIDLAITPATNTPTIRRAPLSDPLEAIVAYVAFPELSVRPLRQRYARLAEDRWRFTSEDGFEAELEVDDLGLVRRYPPFWERVAEAPGRQR